MDKQQLEAIRARDADYNDIFEQQASMSPHIAHRLVAWPVHDRRALLAEVEALLRDVGGPVAGIGWVVPNSWRTKRDAFLAADSASLTQEPKA